MRPLRILALLGLLAAAPALCALTPRPAAAATIVARDVEDLTGRSDLVVVATVLEARTVATPNGPLTQFTLEIEDYLKGEGAERIVINQVGGELDGRMHRIFGDFLVQPGQRVAMFLRQAEGHLWSTLLGWSVFDIQGDGPQAPIERNQTDFGLMEHTDKGARPLPPGALTPPTNLAELTLRVRAAQGL